VVSFANTDIELVRGGGEARRRYLDFLGVQIYASYRPVLRAYERALRGRNALLKSLTPRPRERAAYDSLLVEHGVSLLRLREKLVETLAPRARAAYERISGGKEILAINYVPGAGQNFAEELSRSHPQEMRLRQTIAGPHRDELDLRVDGMPAAQFASEGQQRSVALALKMAQADAFRQLGEGKAPLLLIDDIFGELDAARRNALLDHLPPASQRLVTATAIPWRADLGAETLYELQERKLVRTR